MLALKQRNDEEEARPILYQEYLNKKNQENMVEDIEESKEDQTGKKDFKETFIKYVPLAVIAIIVFVIAVIIFMPISDEATNNKVIVDKEAVIASSDVNSKAIRTDFGQVLRNATESLNQNQQDIADESKEDVSLENKADEDSEIDTSTSAYTNEQVIEVINGVDGKNGLDGVNGVDGKDGANGIGGANGSNGKDGINGKDGFSGKDGINGVDGKDGKDGKSAYQAAVEAGYIGTEVEFGQLLSSIGLKIVDLEGNVTSINSTVDTLNQSLNGIKIAQDAEGNWGYIPSGADTVIPFKKGAEITFLGYSVTSFDVSGHEGFEKFTANNFLISDMSFSINIYSSYGAIGNVYASPWTRTLSPLISYDSSTGKGTITNISTTAKMGGDATASTVTYRLDATYNLYLIS